MKETIFYRQLVQTFPRMEGKNVIITGCTSGTGLVLARTCANLGAKVFMLNRTSERATQALILLKEEDNADVELVNCDLQNFDSVRQAGAYLRETLKDKGCDVLCNNAGVMGLHDQSTVNGYDIQIQTNHLSHFLLIHELMPLLKKSVELNGEARVVNHSSGARRMGKKPILTKYFEANGGNLGGDGFPGLQKWVRYQQSKLANLLLTYALEDRVPEDLKGKIKFLTAHPGPTDSGLQSKTIIAGGNRWLDKYIIRRTLKAAHSVEDGTSGIAICTCAQNVKSGEFYGPAGEGKAGESVLLPAERDLKSEKLLWDLSMKATELEVFF